MGSINSVYLIGNLGKDPVVRTMSDGKTKVANLSVATTQRAVTRPDGTKIDERTDWHNVVAWRQNAEVAEKYIKKGSQICVIGSLRNRTWTDKDGNTRYTTEVMATRLVLLGKADGAVKETPKQMAEPEHKEIENHQPFEGSSTDQNDDLPF